MPNFSSFALQFTGFTAASLSATAAELLIVESGVTGVSGQATLSATELASLAGEGRKVIGYVNTSVTDHNRAYWQAGWITPNGDEPDVGTPTASAPSWLQNNLGPVDFDAAHPGAEATLVDYRDPAWRALVVAQAVAVVEAGFHGVFLDDVARYFEAGHAGASYDPTLADSMMALVIEVAAAVRAVDPDAVVVVNAGVYIGGDSAAGTASQLYADYKAAIDGVLIENQYASEVNTAPPNVLQDAATNYAGVDILALENAANGLDRLTFLQFAATHGLLPYISPDEGYGQFAAAPQIDWNGYHYLAGSALHPTVLLGLWGNDVLQGGEGADTVYGGADNDDLIGLGGQDRLYGDDGDDTVAGGDGNDSLSGGLGHDRLKGEAGDDWAAGGAGNDSITGLDGKDRAYGEAGLDTLTGGNGADSLYGGADDDRLFGEAENDYLAGGDGLDRLYGGLGHDRLYGEAGADTLAGDAGNDSLYAGDGGGALVGGGEEDYLAGGLGVDALWGDTGNDRLYGAAGADKLYGGDGLDTLSGDDGADDLYGGAGNDLLMGRAEDDRLSGGLGHDRLLGGLGRDYLYGQEDNDSLNGEAGNDLLYGGLGNDTLQGAEGRDALSGEAGRDLLQGGADNDVLYGGDGHDTLEGSAGEDALNGGAGNDLLTGGTGGRDAFYFSGDAGRDVITDFDDGLDRINLVAYSATAAELQAAITDWNGGVTVDFARLGGVGSLRVLDHHGQVIVLTASDFLL